MKWRFGATEGELFAGGNGEGSALNQLNMPSGITVDGDSILIADIGNNRVMRWRFGATEGSIVCKSLDPFSVIKIDDYIAVTDVNIHKIKF